MNVQDVVKSLADKGININETEIQAKIETFSKTFHLPADEACRAALSHFASANKQSSPIKEPGKPAVVHDAKIQDTTPASPQIQPVSVQSDTTEKVFSLIVNISKRVPHHLADFSDVVKEAGTAGIAPEKVLEAVGTLMQDQRCIEPLLGQLYPLKTKQITPQEVLQNSGHGQTALIQ